MRDARARWVVEGGGEGHNVSERSKGGMCEVKVGGVVVWRCEEGVKVNRR